MNFINEFQRESKKQDGRGRCLHFSNGIRCNEIISAHSIQKKGQLGLIEENGHIYRLSADLSILQRNSGSPELKKVGVNKATTFAGFCKHHDNSLFEPIDNHLLGPVKSQIALYAYRCLCREYFVKENAVALLEKFKDHRELSPRGKKDIRLNLLGQNIGFQGVQRHKLLYDRALIDGDFEQFEFTYFTCSSKCPIQLSGLFYPDVDFNGRCLQNVGGNDSPLDLITFFTAPTVEGWAFVFGWHSSSEKTCLPFIQSLGEHLATGRKLEDALLRLAISCCENHAIRISWWDSLDSKSKNILNERMLQMIHPHIPVPNDYLAAGCEGIANWQYQYVETSILRTA